MWQGAAGGLLCIYTHIYIERERVLHGQTESLMKLSDLLREKLHPISAALLCFFELIHISKYSLVLRKCYGFSHRTAAISFCRIKYRNNYVCINVADVTIFTTNEASWLWGVLGKFTDTSVGKLPNTRIKLSLTTKERRGLSMFNRKNKNNEKESRCTE